MKLERDKGAQLTLNEKTKSYNIAEVKDLMLTDKTRIYKVALFVQKSDFKIKHDGVLMDYQISIKNKKEAVTFFLQKFLGCKAFADPQIVTQRFYNLTRTFIENIEDELDRVNFLQHLNSYTQKNSPTLDPGEFAGTPLVTSTSFISPTG